MLPPRGPRTLCTPHSGSPHVLGHGEFFGDVRREYVTESFVFASMVATWSAGEMPRHSHENAYFFYVARGIYITAACDDHCGPSTVIFNPPGTTHRDRFHSREGDFFTMSVSPGVSRRVRDASPWPALLPGPQASRIFHEAIFELKNPDNGSDLVLEGLGLELVGRAARLTPCPDAQAPRWLLRSRELLRETCTSGITIAAVARTAGVHPVHLARIFRQYFRCSPGEYLRSCRIEKACRLLRTSGLPLAEVAQQLGFSDQSQLTHAFRRATGRTPGDYRRNLSG